MTLLGREYLKKVDFFDWITNAIDNLPDTMYIWSWYIFTIYPRNVHSLTGLVWESEHKFIVRILN